MSNAQLLRNGVEAFPAMLEAIRNARSSVAMETYIFSADGTGLQFREELVRAAGRGVRVAVLVDAVGCWTVPDEFWHTLRRAKVRLQHFRPIRRGFLPFRNHRKLLLVDDRLAFVGGMNIGDEYAQGRRGEAPWRDNVLRIEGPEAALLRGSFESMYSRADRPLRLREIIGMDEEEQTPAGADAIGNVRFLESGPEDIGRPVRKAYRELIGEAQTGIDLAMSYFFPPGRILRGLRRAVRRGVRVRLLLSARTDVAIARWAARGLYGKLLRSGIQVWEYQPAMLHAKLAVVDDVVIVGSANLDLRSSMINYELVAAVADRELAVEARRDFEDDLRSAVSVSYEAWRQRRWTEKVREKLSYWLLARADLFFAKSRLVRGRW